jgi:hypothetical protein
MDVQMTRSVVVTGGRGGGSVIVLQWLSSTSSGLVRLGPYVSGGGMGSGVGGVEEEEWFCILHAHGVEVQ